MMGTQSFVLLRWLDDEKISVEPASSGKKAEKIYPGYFEKCKWAGKYYEVEAL